VWAGSNWFMAGCWLQDVYLQMPPITRFYSSACFLTTLACQLEIVNPFQVTTHHHSSSFTVLPWSLPCDVGHAVASRLPLIRHAVHVVAWWVVVDLVRRRAPM
jgi:hypothetical protein